MRHSAAQLSFKKSEHFKAAVFHPYNTALPEILKAQFSEEAIISNDKALICKSKMENLQLELIKVIVLVFVNIFLSLLKAPYQQ